MVLSLPVELIDYILDYLNSDHPSLLTCCVLSSSWRTCAQRQLFRSVDIAKEHVSVLLSTALLATPHLAAHIRAVRTPIRLSGCRAVLAHGPFRRVTDLTLSDADYCDSQILSSNDVPLAPLGTAFPGVCDSQILSSNDVPLAPLGTAFPGVRTLAIEHAKFSSLSVLAPLLSIFQGAPYLHLRSLHIPTTPASPKPHMAKWHMPPVLTTLILEDCSPCVNTLWMGDGTLLLRRLVVQDCRYYFYAEYAAALAMRAANTLEELDIKAQRLSDLEVFSHAYTARPCALRSLQLHVSVINPRVNLVHTVRLARAIAPDDQTRIMLTVEDWIVPGEWSAARLAPSVWKCENVTAGRMYEGAEALEILGI